MSALFSEKTTPLTQLTSPIFAKYGVEVWVKRDDLNHPLIQGNKWHKLRLNIEAAQQQGKSQLLTFGGAFSNHIAATAVAAHAIEMESIGIIRGEELKEMPNRWSETLKHAHRMGMQFEFISRARYRQKNNLKYLQRLSEQYPNAYILPEGGSNSLAVAGFEQPVAQLMAQIPEWSHLFCAVGTGGTLAGLIKHTEQTIRQHAPHKTRFIYGIPVLKQGDSLRPIIQQWIGETGHVQWQLLTDYHFGGYAKTTPDLLAFKSEFEQQFAIPLDPVYTVKMVAAFYDQLQKGQIKAGSKVVLWHTGGLQGNLPPKQD